jgi:hypothetical protein
MLKENPHQIYDVGPLPILASSKKQTTQETKLEHDSADQQLQMTRGSQQQFVDREHHVTKKKVFGFVCLSASALDFVPIDAEQPTTFILERTL